MGVRFLKIAAIYLLVSVSMGLYMGITHHRASPAGALSK